MCGIKPPRFSQGGGSLHLTPSPSPSKTSTNFRARREFVFPRSRGNLRVWPGYIFFLSEIWLVRALRPSENLRNRGFDFPSVFTPLLACKFPRARICKLRGSSTYVPFDPLISVVSIITSNCCVSEGAAMRGVTGQKRVTSRLGRHVGGKTGLAH